MQNIILLLFLIWYGSSKIMASLLLIQYDPMVFQLSFTSPVATPKFQLLQNNIYLLNYQFISGGNTGNVPTTKSGMQLETGSTTKITQNAISTGNSSNNTTIKQSLDTVFVFSASLGSGYKLNTQLQTYTLLFNDPLQIGNGTLALQCFLLTAEKIPIIIPFNAVFGTIVAICCYLSSYFSILGQIFIEFSQLYALFIYGVGIKTTVYVSISQYLLMLPPLTQIINEKKTVTESKIYINMCIPLIIVGVTFLTGYLIKKVKKGSQSIPVRVVYEFFTYGLFHSMGTLFMFVILFNSIMVITYLSSSIIVLSTFSTYFIKFLIYLGITTVFFYCYMVYRVLNPFRLTQNKWKAYIQSQDYKQCKKLHDGLHNRIWFKRNATFINLLKKLVLVILFFTVPGFAFILLIFEFMHLLLTFISKPFREEFYYNSVISIRIAMLIYYVAVALQNLYQNLSPIVINYKASYSFMTFRLFFFLLILLAIFILIIYEFYQKCSNLNYQINLVREENAFKIKITERKISHSTSNEKREGSVLGDEKRQTISDFQDNSLGRSKSISSPLKRRRKTNHSKTDSPSIRKMKRSNTKKSDKSRKETSSSKKQKMKQTQLNQTKDRSKVELTAADEIILQHKVSFKQEKQMSGQSQRDSKKSKWIRQGLLAEIAHK